MPSCACSHFQPKGEPPPGYTKDEWEQEKQFDGKREPDPPAHKPNCGCSVCEHTDAYQKPTAQRETGKESPNTWPCGHSKWDTQRDCVVCLQSVIDILNGRLTSAQQAISDLEGRLPAVNDSLGTIKLARLAEMEQFKARLQELDANRVAGTFPVSNAVFDALEERILELHKRGI